MFKLSGLFCIFKGMFRAILDFLKSLLNFGSGFQKTDKQKEIITELRTPAITAEAKKDQARKEFKTENIDRKARKKRPKRVARFTDIERYNKFILDPKVVYHGTKKEIINKIKRDPEDALTHGILRGKSQQKDFRIEIEKDKSNHYFAIYEV